MPRMVIPVSHILCISISVFLVALFLSSWSHLELSSSILSSSVSSPADPESMASLKYLVLPALTKHTATVIFIHGLGDTGHGWQPVADLLRTDSGLSHVKWVLPHSPHRAVTANAGIVMPSWFDIYSFGFETTEDERGMLASVGLINQLIAKEVESGIEPGRIFLGGFSQGGAMTLLVGLTQERKLAGLSILSGWLPLKEKFKSMASPHAKSMPVFWGHGSDDPLVKLQFSKVAVEFLANVIGIPPAKTNELHGVHHRIYPGLGHGTCQQELDDLRNFIKKAIPKE